MLQSRRLPPLPPQLKNVLSAALLPVRAAPPTPATHPRAARLGFPHVYSLRVRGGCGWRGGPGGFRKGGRLSDRFLLNSLVGKRAVVGGDLRGLLPADLREDCQRSPVQPAGQFLPSSDGEGRAAEGSNQARDREHLGQHRLN